MLLIITIFFLLIAICVLIYSYYGGFNKIIPEIAVGGGELFAYRMMVGDYRRSGVIMNQVYYALLIEENIETRVGCCIFYDSAAKAARADMRSDIGCFIEDRYRHHNCFADGRFLLRQFPRKEYATVDFPYKGYFSVVIAARKVHGAMRRFLREHGLREDGAFTEIYDKQAGKIFFRKEL